MSDKSNFSCRQFIGGSLATSAAALAASTPLAAAQPGGTSAPKRKIKLGVIGLGGRGQWITKFFQQHGGYEIHGVADYFPEVAEYAGKALGVDAARRFSGLSGYKKLYASGIEAVAIEDVPYFYAEQAAAAVEAGLHVYMAKPVAVDVPGCLAIGGRRQVGHAEEACFPRRLSTSHRPGGNRTGPAGPRGSDRQAGAHRVDWVWLARLARSAPGSDHREPFARRDLAVRHGPQRRYHRLLRYSHH